MISASSGTALLPVYRIRPLALASVSQYRNSFTYRLNDGVRFDLPIFAWYIEGATQNVLVDTGANAHHMKKYRNFEAMDMRTPEVDPEAVEGGVQFASAIQDYIDRWWKEEA